MIHLLRIAEELVNHRKANGSPVWLEHFLGSFIKVFGKRSKLSRLAREENDIRPTYLAVRKTADERIWVTQVIDELHESDLKLDFAA